MSGLSFPLDRLMGVRITACEYLTVSIPHAMSSERTLAKVSGGRWFAKRVTAPDPDMRRLRDGSLVGHPATIEALCQYAAKLSPAEGVDHAQA